RRRAEKAAVSGAAELDAKGYESGATSIARSARGSAPSSHSAGRSGALAGDHDRAGSASGETDQGSDFCKSDQVAGKDGERVRAAHGNHSQGQGEQAHRVWQTGQDPGSGKPSRDSLRGVCRATPGFNSVAALDPGAPTEIGTSTALGGRRCGILFPRERESCASPGGAEDVGAQQEYEKWRTETSSASGLVS